MDDELKEIMVIRKKLGLTQTELAKRAGVSQSLIAKIESDRIDPTFSNAKKIFSALKDLEKKEELIAADLLNKKIVNVRSCEPIKGCISKMKQLKISQIPVIEDHKVIGMVSEANLIEAVLNQDIKTVEEVMSEAPPVVSKNASVNAVSALLRFYPIVLVTENGKFIGLISKSDLLSKVYG
tara:strand:- start:1715 stop:2257 length:543 start_codon:yes stop_codon:yes gene_type:complete